MLLINPAKWALDQREKKRKQVKTKDRDEMMDTKTHDRGKESEGELLNAIVTCSKPWTM